MNNQVKDNQKTAQIRSVGIAESIIIGMTMEQTERIYEIIEDLLEGGGAVSGSADDFHNLSVSIINITEDYETAYELVQKGLVIHPTNTDLIADAIRYGSNCGKYDECNALRIKLEKITRRRWTWRAYSFLIDYLTESLDRYEEITDDQYENKFSEIKNYVEEYQEKYSDYEDSWYSEFELYWNTNQRNRAKDILKEIMERIEYCPKVWLRYADILISEGKLSQAEGILIKLRSDGNLAENHNAAYIYYLHGKCKYERYLKSKEMGEIDPALAWDAYNTFALVSKIESPNANLFNRAQHAMRQVEIEADLKSES